MIEAQSNDSESGFISGWKATTRCSAFVDVFQPRPLAALNPYFQLLVFSSSFAVYHSSRSSSSSSSLVVLCGLQTASGCATASMWQEYSTTTRQCENDERKMSFLFFGGGLFSGAFYVCDKGCKKALQIQTERVWLKHSLYLYIHLGGR